MSAASEKAFRYKRLRDDEAFVELMAEVRKRQIDRFQEIPGSAESREEAHAILRALAEIDGAIQAALDDHAVEQKRKGQHRGSD